MTSTKLAPAFLFCKCGHTGRRHEVVDGGEHEGACTAAGCPCSSFAEGSDPVARTDDGPKATGGPMPDTIRGVELEGPPEQVRPAGGYTTPLDPRSFIPDGAVIAVGDPLPEAPAIRNTNHPPMLTRAAQSPNAKTRKLGAKIEQLLADLAGILDHEARTEAARRRLASLDSERERLLAELGLPTRMPRQSKPVECICGRPFASAQACGVHAARQRERGDDSHGQRPEPEHGIV